MAAAYRTPPDVKTKKPLAIELFEIELRDDIRNRYDMQEGKPMMHDDSEAMRPAMKTG